MSVHVGVERRLGAALALLTVLGYVLIGVLLTPILLRYLSKQQFGLYQLIGAFLGYLTLIDFGIGGTLTRFSAKYRALGDKLQQDNLFSLCLKMYSAIGVILLIFGYVIYTNLEHIFSASLTPAELSQARVMFLIVLWSVFVTILGRAYIGVLDSYEKFVFSRIITIFCLLSKLVVVASILAWGANATGVVVVEAIINVVSLAANCIYARIVLNVRFYPRYWDWKLSKEVLAYSFWLFVTTLVLQINFQVGRVMLGIMTATSLVGIYAVGMQFNTVYNGMSSALKQVLLPKTMRMVVNNSSGEELTRFLIGPSRYQLMLLGGSLTGFLLFGRQFVRLWAGQAYLDAWTVAVIVMVPVSIPLFQNVVVLILEAKSLNRTRALINLGTAVANVIVSVFLVRRYGLLGPAIGTSVTLILGHGIILNLYYHYWVGLNMPLFFRETCRRILPAILVSLVVGVLLVFLPVGAGWFSLAVRGALHGAVYAALLWWYAMNANEHEFFKSSLLGALKALPALRRSEVEESV
jgi:O-antigen/teichoic acid export membrane protein